MNNHQRDGAIFILLSVVGYSFLPIWVKQIQASGLGSLDIAILRFAFATPIFWLIIRARRLPKPDKPLPRRALLGMGSLLALAALTGFWGLERLPAGTLVVLFYSYPAMVAVLSLLLGEKLPSKGWAALALTTIGIFFTVPDFTAGLSGDNLIGVILALVNALLVAVYFILSGRLLRGHTAMAQASAWSITGGLLVLALIVPFRGLSLPSTPSAWAFLLVLASFSTVFPVFFLNSGIQKVGAARAAILGTVEPVLTTVLAMIFLGERMQPVQLIGAAFILASIILLQTQPRSDRPLMEAPAGQ